MSDWLPPSAQQYPASESDGVKKLVGAVQDVAQKTREATKNLLRTAGIFLTEAGMRIESALTVNGDLSATGNTDIDGTLNVDAASTFGGTMVVNGDATFQGNLAVPNGSITNAALQNPVAWDTRTASASGPMNLTTGEQTFCTVSYTVPAGYTKAMIHAQGSIGVVNPTVGPGSVAGRVYIDHPNAALSSFGARRWQSAAQGYDASTFPVDSTDFAVSGGQVITVRLTVQSGPTTGWGSTPGGATLNTFAMFTR
jgi:hypothetical protein